MRAHQTCFIWPYTDLQVGCHKKRSSICTHAYWIPLVLNWDERACVEIDDLFCDNRPANRCRYKRFYGIGNAQWTAQPWRVDRCARACSINYINRCEKRSIFTPFKAVKVMFCPYSSQNSTSKLRGRYWRSEESESWSWRVWGRKLLIIHNFFPCNYNYEYLSLLIIH